MPLNDFQKIADLPRPEDSGPTRVRVQRWKAAALTLVVAMAFVGAGAWILHEVQHPVQSPSDLMTPAVVMINGDEPIQPIPLEIKEDPRKVSLGRKLFHDRRLSRDDTISCASCHDLAKGGTDQLPRSKGIGGAYGDVNSPTVFNTALNFRQFWDGRARTLEDQIDGPIYHPKEMGSTWPDIIIKLRQDPAYVKAFHDLYEEGIVIRSIKDAIATFERSLLTPNSRFDRFLRGDRQALTAKEIAGYQLFKEYGCVSCHQGANVGGNMFQRLGVLDDYFRDRGTVQDEDPARHRTGHEQHDHTFKVPSLRNVALTPPYFHDGSAQTLESAVRVMAKYQVGRSIPSDKVDQIVAFLRTLTGDYPNAVRENH
jgi:cytochrome c peroxidase